MESTTDLKHGKMNDMR